MDLMPIKNMIISIGWKACNTGILTAAPRCRNHSDSTSLPSFCCLRSFLNKALNSFPRTAPLSPSKAVAAAASSVLREVGVTPVAAKSSSTLASIIAPSDQTLADSLSNSPLELRLGFGLMLCRCPDVHEAKDGGEEVGAMELLVLACCKRAVYKELAGDGGRFLLVSSCLTGGVVVVG